tara:strand:+ start:518 stop:697 length:180 start_codon:yes stop_codon:yes gene_type:complete
MDREMFDKLEEMRSLLAEPEIFNRLVAKYEADPSEENLREIIDHVTLEVAKGNVKGWKS